MMNVVVSRQLLCWTLFVPELLLNVGSYGAALLTVGSAENACQDNMIAENVYVQQLPQSCNNISWLAQGDLKS